MISLRQHARIVSVAEAHDHLDRAEREIAAVARAADDKADRYRSDRIRAWADEALDGIQNLRTHVMPPRPLCTDRPPSKLSSYPAGVMPTYSSGCE